MNQKNQINPGSDSRHIFYRRSVPKQVWDETIASHLLHIEL